MEGKLFSSHQSGRFFVDDMIKVLFPTLYLDLACNYLCFPPSKKYKEQKRKSYFLISILFSLLSVDCTDCD